MNEAQALEALAAIGLRGESRATRHFEWRRIFMIDADGVTQGRLSFRNGVLESEKFYVSKVARGPQVVDDEFWPWAWRLWTERRERLDRARWNLAIAEAKRLARAERAEKQAWRDANPKPGRRKPLELNFRKHLYPLIFGSMPPAPCRSGSI